MIKHFKKHWPLLGLGVIVFIVGFYLIRAGKEVMKETGAKALISGEGLRLEDIHYTQDDPNAGLKWVLDAKAVDITGREKEVYFHDFSLKLEPQERPWFKLDGRKGVYSTQTGIIQLEGNLEGHTQDGYRFFTEKLLFNEKERFLSTDQHVRFYGPSFSVVGQGLHLDLEKETLKVLSEVTTTVNGEL